jgi:hypothetical protein
MRTLLMLASAVGTVLGCASAPAPADAQTPPPTGEQGPTLLPSGLGTLRQDEVTISLRSGPLLIKATPLDEGILRLLAPDTYERLRSLADSKRAEAAAQVGVPTPELFLVSFFSYQPDVSFQPEDLQLTYQGRILRPAAILPVTNGFGQQRLKQQDNQTAIYAFDVRIDYNQLFIVRYGFQQNDDWIRILPKLEIERTKVRARTTTVP